MYGGEEEDGTSRDEVALGPSVEQPYLVKERDRAAAENRILAVGAWPARTYDGEKDTRLGPLRGVRASRAGKDIAVHRASHESHAGRGAGRYCLFVGLP